MAGTERFVWQKLRRHFGTDDLTSLVSSRREFTAHLLPDLQSVIEDQLEPWSPELFGFYQKYEINRMKLSDLTISKDDAVWLAPVQRQDIDIGEDKPYASLNNGLWLIRVDDGIHVAIMLSKFLTDYGPQVQIEIGHLPCEQGQAFAKRFMHAVQAKGTRSRYYRGKAVSLEFSGPCRGTAETMRVHKLPAVSRDNLVLSKATMDQLERHIFDFVRYREELKRLGQSGRKGILLHGHPGTGKTHIIHHIAANLPDHTTILVTAEQMLNIGEYFALARILQPCVLVLEDVDLVGRSRENISGLKAETRLNRLLNEVDGLGTDGDIFTIMTTNRVDALEEALALRSGRVDVSLEIPLPDDDCRERLIKAYGHVLNFQGEALAEVVSRSNGGSAAYVKEMVRRLVQQNIALGGSLVISREDVVAVFADAEPVINPLKRNEEMVRIHILEEDDCGCC
ncbi:AAA family ATPase [Rhizobium leguminosarum]|uniref:AAA family ATPase n=1 Tax=Rhizobium leguminosarum TaxID=384 RepID=UPI001D79A9C9|nr:ATP-binding protein [Rhizobium leguminosarum]MBP2444191.1 hypothetical protein [Rhizobium leguminosarum]MBP2444265.1 hypothetical protein [Rhizobium leguminosarum]